MHNHPKGKIQLKGVTIMSVTKAAISTLLADEIEEAVKTVKQNPKAKFQPKTGKVSNKVGFGRKGGFGKASMRRSGRGR